MVWCFIVHQIQNPKVLAEITNRTANKSQQAKRLLQGSYADSTQNAAPIYSAAET
jgi:hypothetical protein